MKPCIVFQTDFGTKWGAVASMKGVCKQVDPALECVDLTHEIEQYNILAASRELVYVLPFWPKGTVFVSVVDPGVGTERRACVALLRDGNYVGTPDNGTLTHALEQIGVAAVRQIDETVNRYPGTEDVAVFHGRDLFAYTAARLAAGVISFEGVGPAYPVEQIVRFDQALVHQTNIIRTRTTWGPSQLAMGSDLSFGSSHMRRHTLGMGCERGQNRSQEDRGIGINENKAATDDNVVGVYTRYH